MPHHDKITLQISYTILIIMAVTFVVFKFFGIGAAHPTVTPEIAFKDYQQATVTFPTANYKVYLAKTAVQQSQGLSNLESLPINQGMLFIFDQPSILKFWMKDMNFNLDFVWLRDGKIVDLTENVSSDLIDRIKTISPKEPADSVLELNARQIYKSNLKVGDEVGVINK